MSPAPTILVNEIGPQKFSLSVIFDGQRFDVGVYQSRDAAMSAGRFFIKQKEAERDAAEADNDVYDEEDEDELEM
jgi:hypothetical protein